MKARARLVLIGALAVSCVGCDQVSKMVAHHQLDGHPPVPLFKGFIHLFYVENSGAFLGLGAGLSSEARFWVLGLGVALVLASLTVYALVQRDTHPFQLAAIGLIVGGGLGNLLDRMTLGIVRDFLIVGIDPMRTGVFNLADSAILLGTVALTLSLGRRGAGGRPPTALPRVQPGSDDASLVHNGTTPCNDSMPKLSIAPSMRSERPAG